MTVGIVGLGYVGLPLAVAFAEAGVPAVGVDVDAELVDALRGGRSHIEDISDETLAAQAERLHPGSRDWNIANTPKLVGGLTPEGTERAAELYRAVCEEVVPLSSPEAAELAKLLENIFRSVNIALVNELSILAHRMGIDFW